MLPAKPSTEIKPFALIKYELSLVQDGIIMWGLRVIIPNSLRNSIRQDHHFKHPGTSRMKRLARIHVRYPKINEDIEQRVKTCELCQKVANMPPSASPHPWDWPTKPKPME